MLITRAVPDLFFPIWPDFAGFGFCRIWNDKSDRSRIFKLSVIYTNLGNCVF